MNALGLALIALVAGGLAACSTYNPPELAEATIVSGASQAGAGTVQSVSVLSAAAHEASASAGGSSPRIYRLFVKMDNGSTQTIDVANPTFMPDERIAISEDGRVLRQSGSTLRR